MAAEFKSEAKIENQVYPQQMTASNEIITNLHNKEPWILLLAQPQSGKSGTYMDVAYKSIEQNLFKSVVIITGSPDLSLIKQVEANIKDITEIYKMENPELCEDIDRYEKIKILKPSQCNNYKIRNDTLFIHDESHYAQDINNIIGKFMKKMGLDGALLSTNNVDYLRERNIAFISVSATPFSELIQNQSNKGLQKKIVTLYPGDTYIGINQLPIKYIEQRHMTMDFIEEKIQDPKYNGKYIIVRTHNTKDTGLSDLCNLMSVPYHTIFQGDNYDILDVAPDNQDCPHIIHISGKGRMGQVFAKRTQKRYIGAVIETSKLPNTDTAIQGLLGRMCGYYNSVIDVYISIKCKSDINKYADYWSTPYSTTISLTTIKKAKNVIPSKETKNTKDIYVKDKSGKVWKKTVPIKIEMRLINIHDPNYGNINKLKNRNKEEVICELKNYIQDFIPELYDIFDDDESENYITLRDISKYPNLKESLDNALDNNEPYTHNFTNCVCENITEKVKPITIINKDPKYIYLCYYKKTDLNWNDIDNVSSVHSRSIYNVHMEDDNIILITNACQPIVIPPITGEDQDKFKQHLELCVRRTKIGEPEYDINVQKMITSIVDFSSGSSTGIYFNSQVFSEDVLKQIFKEVSQKHRIKIKSNKFRGRQIPGYIRYKSITWTFA
jgi:hypothetical protein